MALRGALKTDFWKNKFLHPCTIWNKKEHNKLLKEQEPGTPEYSKSGWRHVIYKLKLFLHRFFFKWRTIFNVSQFLLFLPCALDTPSIFSWILSTHPTIDHPEHGAFIRLLILYIVHAGWGGERQAQKSLKFEFHGGPKVQMHWRKLSFCSFLFFANINNK